MNAFFQAFLNLLLQKASFKPLNRESFLEDVKERLKYIWQLFALILLTTGFVIGYPDQNREGFVAALGMQKYWWILIVLIIIFSIMVFASLFSFISNVSKYKDDSNIEREMIRFKDNEIVGRLIELEKKIGVEYSDSFKFFQKLIKKYNQSIPSPISEPNTKSTESFSKPYVEFIKDFKKYTDLPLEELTSIFTYASNSSSTIFKCVIAFDEYFEDKPNTAENEILWMLQYFCCFKNGAEKNHINRIFTIPGIPDDPVSHIGQTKSIFNTPQTKNKNNVILKYLITNKICSIDTYLLVYDNNNSDTKDEFFALADYVIAISANGSSIKENKIFFAYPNEKTISTHDPFIMALMVADYEYRLSKLGNSNHTFNIIELKRANKEIIYSSLNFNTSTKDGKNEVNSVITELEAELIAICKKGSIKDFHSEAQIKNLLSGYRL